MIKKFALAIHVSLFVLFSLLMYFNAFATLDLRTQDYFYQKESRSDERIVIIGIDDESLEVLGKWPWKRTIHSELISYLNEANPAAIGYDVIFAEESVDKNEDNSFVKVVSQFNNVVLPVYANFGSSAKRGELEALSITTPFAELNAVANTGHINTLLDSDGIVRKTIVKMNYDSEQVNSFSWELYNLYKNHVKEKAYSLSDIPLDDWGRTTIKYTGKPQSVEMIPFHLVYTGEISEEYFRDKIVLVGPTAAGLADDYYFSPLAPDVPMYGVEIHANIIQQYLKGEFWSEVSFIIQLLIMTLLAVVAYLIFRRFKLNVSLVTLFVTIGIFLIIAKLLANLDNGYLLSFIYPLIFLTVQFVITILERVILEQLEKKRVTDVFGKYVAPQIVEEILEAGEEGLKLGGTRRNITVLFVDIRGFTPLSESLAPEEVVSILNDYLAVCAEAIFAYGGTLDKYIGDAAMAIFNAPLDLENHELNAIKTAWKMKEGGVKLQQDLQAKFGKSIQFGVGVHTGTAIVGNIGAQFRMDYTAIGDTVNTAARIESISTAGQILISEEVYERVKDFVKVKKLGLKEVKGKQTALLIYEVVDLLV